MKARALSKRAFPYLLVAAGGFLIAYLLLFACLVLRPGGLFGAAPAREAAAVRARV